MTKKAFINKLTSQSRCPVCGGELAMAQKSPEDATYPLADVRFICRARFWADSRTIISANPCRSGSLLAAKLMSIEVEGRSR